jgi:transposase
MVWRRTVPRAARLTLPYSDGPAEGANTRCIKSQMYGYAGFALLHHRILAN